MQTSTRKRTSLRQGERVFFFYIFVSLDLTLAGAGMKDSFFSSSTLVFLYKVPEAPYRIHLLFSLWAGGWLEMQKKVFSASSSATAVISQMVVLLNRQTFFSI